MIRFMEEQHRRRSLPMLWTLFILFGIWQTAEALTVDNQLVSARNDCFERIALEAMLPFEKTFRTEDTNSLKMCKEKCLQAGEKCQAISFGVHRRGNGTCQLSSEQYGSGGGGRPGGVIFDPDFDLYTRKTNCFDLSDNSIAPGPGPSPISPGPTPANLPNRPLEVGNTPVLIVNPTPHTDEPAPPQLPAISAPSLPPPPGLGDRLYFSHDLYPLYKYPALYENNYPAPNEDVYIPGGYAANAPEVEDHYHGPPSLENEEARPTPHGPPRPIFGLGYGNGYSYGSPERYTPPTMRPPSASSDERPHYGARPPRPDYPPPPPRPYDSSTPPSYGLRPSPSYEPHREPRPDYTNRPDPPMQSTHDGDYGMPGPSARPPPPYDESPPLRDDYVRRNGSAMRPGDGYGGYSLDDDKTIATYFNPDDYMQGSNKRPMGDRDRDRDRDRDHDRLGYPMDKLKACFRRVLAGKRIAPHWVRRSISCERVEECMRECGHERRFMCEGFNYRLDPSGHGQGDCELIEMPLSQMDLYSSAHRRDSNLLRHPDYDYYERDRNAPSSCRRNACQDCSKGPLSSNPIYLKPSTGPGPSSSGSGYGDRDRDRDRDRNHFRPPPPSSSAIDHYRGPSSPPGPPRAPSSSYEHRPFSSDYQGSHTASSSSSSSSSSSYEFSSHGSGSAGSDYFGHTPPSSYGSDHSYADRHDPPRYSPVRPDRWETLPSSSGYDGSAYRPPRPETDRVDKYRPPYRPGPDFSPYRPHEPSRPIHNYLDRDGSSAGPSPYKKPNKFVPYLIGGEENWGNYGGSYGGSNSNSKHTSYWGLSESQRRKDHDFNYFQLGAPHRESNSVLGYPGSSYEDDYPKRRNDYRQQWTRRPGPDECSAKTSEGFRLHKTAIRHAYNVPTLTECERLCSDQRPSFSCHTFSYRYNQAGRDNCMLCDRPVNMLDYYVDIEPDRDYDIYSMADDMDVCRQPLRRHDSGAPNTALSDPRNAQCFFRAIDATRFFKSIVRDSLTVRSVGECEMECIRSTKFTCRAFAYRYGQQRHTGIIDNCQLSDWPVRDMDKERHLILDAAFDIFERASYGHGCEIQPIVDEKHKKLCYLGYGSPARLLPPAIKKLISVPSEMACKKECIRFRETTPFKCYAFSYGSHASSHNCELSDLDQTELKLDVHYTHTKERDFWLFAWNPFDWTCRDKVNTIGGSRVNNDRRMDIFREPGDVAWRHYTVSGKPCRRSSPCEKNLITGFYSCETDGSEVGSWDYCCKADHPCGYSKGFDYPWCFVGDESDQWRKCSDRYYPGKNGTQPTHSHLGLASPKEQQKQKHQPHSHQHSHSQPATAASSEYSQHPPRPGGLQSLSDFAAARLWPVTYLYSEGPPNATEFSNFVDCNKESC
ncbi:uncharacterized protein LOC6591181 isoform X1 [Drosophila persimilis]|uniref:uncharacterized protein LOC6591181 isoform X1 n=1 Tax=Drosophila persimilis TaxID=7234 RepID=UPI000F08033F|nr:uncharacterized protein LOC6591181 isoform X1 [Drosophila persimilis]XP_026842344.1 uncharacterized protein LOC6591181 isoform X1 [Drosophila persimilis]